jgi:hypothetical protein
MIKPKKKPEMAPRELRNGTGWFVLVNWGNWPSEQVGGFPTEEEAQKWIDQESSGWFKARFEPPPLFDQD